jgi:hypothetical protein
MATQVHPDSPQAKFDAAKAAADEIMNRVKAAHRNLTASELDQVGKQLSIAEEIKPAIDASNRAKELLGVFYDGGEPHRDGYQSDDGHDYKATTARAWAEKAMTDLTTIATKRGGGESFGGGAPQGLKALLSGTVTLGGLLTDPVTNPNLATSVLQLIPRITDGASGNQEDGTGAFTHLVESAATNNAATSADGTTKPTSTVTFVEKPDRYRVFANLSEALPERYLDDYQAVDSSGSTQVPCGAQSSTDRVPVSSTARQARCCARVLEPTPSELSPRPRERQSLLARSHWPCHVLRSPGP